MFAISCEIDGRVPMNLYLFLEKARSTPHLLYVHKKWRVCGITHTFQANGKSLASSPAPEVRRFGNTWIAQSIVPKRPSKLYPKGPPVRLSNVVPKQGTGPFGYNSGPFGYNGGPSGYNGGPFGYNILGLLGTIYISIFLGWAFWVQWLSQFWLTQKAQQLYPKGPPNKKPYINCTQKAQ